MARYFVNRKMVLETVQRNAMLRVQDIYDALSALPVRILEDDDGKKDEEVKEEQE